MKSFKEFKKVGISEDSDYYEGDEMTMSELKIAINAANNIIDMLENGGSIQRWQISAIVKASDELASVCTNMRVDYEDQDDYEYDEYDSPSSYSG